ncbi:MAG TPA: hypothetical protein VIK91_06615 [Nannocystis sp.]
MSRKLFVGGLSWNTTDEGLRAAFGRFGVVSEAKVVTDRETGRSRGFGFVAFQNPADGEAARQAMDGATLDQRQIRVSIAEDKPRGPRPDRSSESTGQGRTYGGERGEGRPSAPQRDERERQRPSGPRGGDRQNRYDDRQNRFDERPGRYESRSFDRPGSRGFSGPSEGRRRDRDRDRGRDLDDGEGRSRRRAGRGRRRHEDTDGDLDMDY